MNPIILYVYILFWFVLFDALWFTLYSYKKIYKPQIDKINNNTKFKIRKIGAIVTYAILSVGLFMFLYYCRSKVKGVQLKYLKFLILGAIFGFVVYGTYNGTNYSTIEKYSLKTAITDTVWGTVLCGVISCIVSFSLK